MVVSSSSSMLSSSTLDIGGYAFMSIYNRLKITSQLATTLQLKEKNVHKINSRIFHSWYLWGPIEVAFKWKMNVDHYVYNKIKFLTGNSIQQ